MEHQLMLRTAIVLLALTGAGGLLMAAIRFSGKPQPPSAIAMLHGLLAAAGLTLVLYAGFTRGLPGMGWGGLALLALAALGGIVLNLQYHIKGIPLPKGIILGHAGLAVAVLLVLALGSWNVTST